MAVKRSFFIPPPPPECFGEDAKSTHTRENDVRRGES